MKAIYINLDPYLAQIAAWIDAGKPGTVPFFDPLPFSVTIPIGQDIAFFMQAGTFADGAAQIIPWGDNDLGWEVTGATTNDIGVDSGPDGTGGEASCAFSSILSSQKTYWGHVPSSANTITAIVFIASGEGEDILKIPFTVLVRRETASGPVDLVDFTPPAAELTADAINYALGGTGVATDAPLAGVSLTGVTDAPAPSADDIKSALAAAGSGALEGVHLDGTLFMGSTVDKTEIEGTNCLTISNS